jgi:hypothetical protein
MMEARVGDEGALALDEGPQAREIALESLGQVAQLIGGKAIGKRRAEIRRVTVAHPQGELTYRGNHAPSKHPASPGGEQHR